VKLDKRTRWLLATLVAVLLVALALQLDRGGEAVGPSAGARSASRAPRETPLPTEIVQVEVDRLEPPSGTFQPGRDIFRYGPKEPPPSQRPAEPQVAEATPTPAPPPKEPAKVEPTGPRPPSAGHLKYLGRFGPEARPIAVLVSGQEIYNARSGEVVEDKFVVEKIGLESLDLGYVGFPDEPPARLVIGG
jgi:hypothetical protein